MEISEATVKKVMGKEFLEEYGKSFRLIKRLEVLSVLSSESDSLQEKVASADREVSPSELKLMFSEYFILHFYSLCKQVEVFAKRNSMEVWLPEYYKDGRLKRVRHKAIAHMGDVPSSQGLAAWKTIAKNYGDLYSDLEKLKKSLVRSVSVLLNSKGITPAREET